VSETTSDTFATAYYEASSPSLLAQQPATLPSMDATPGKNWGLIFTALEQRLGGLRSDRYSWWSHWADLAAYILPRRFEFLVTADKTNRGGEINTNIVDATGTLAMQVCAAGMWSGLTSPSRPWFKLGVGLPWIALDAAGSAWIEDTEQKLRSAFQDSNFYQTMAQAFEDVSTFGTSPVILYEDHEEIIRCYLPCAGEFYLAVGGKQTVDTLYREERKSVLGIVDFFGLENCPAEVRTHWENGGASLDKEFVVCHAIEPNTALADRGKGQVKVRVVPGTFAYREVYWLRGIKTEQELSRRGFKERPFFVARWRVKSNDAYARSPGMDALGDIKQLQLETRRKAEFIEKGVRPPMGADPELKNEPSSIIPGQVTYVSSGGGKKGFWPLFEVQAAMLAPMVEDIKEIQQRIEKAFFVDVFMAITQMEGVQPRNELELNKRDLERLQVLGPFINLFENECAGPAIQRVLGILQRRNLLAPLPPSLAGVPLKVDFVSMLNLAQRASENGEITSTVATAAQMSAAAKASQQPDPLDVIDMDEALRSIATNTNFPQKAIRQQKVVDQMRAAKAQQASQMTAAANAGPAVDAAHTLSQTDPSGGALGAMLGLGGPK
jgi:hypothetical protein